MNITVNGKDHVLDRSDATLSDLLSVLNQSPKGLIIAREASLYREEHFDATSIQDGDRLELIHFMGGG